eukprot:1605490-Rhodomonas_salina.1
MQSVELVFSAVCFSGNRTTRVRSSLYSTRAFSTACVRASQSQSGLSALELCMPARVSMHMRARVHRAQQATSKQPSSGQRPVCIALNPQP